MKKDNSKIQKQASLLVFCVIFLFSNHPSKSTGSPFTEADPKGVKVVSFVAKRLNLYPHTVQELITSKIVLKPWYFTTVLKVPRFEQAPSNRQDQRPLDLWYRKRPTAGTATLPWAFLLGPRRSF